MASADRIGLVRIYLRRFRSQSIGKSIREVLNPRLAARHIRLLALGDTRGRANFYLPSLSRSEEIRFCVEMLDCAGDAVDRAFGELENDAELLRHLQERYRSVRRDSSYPLEIGRFKVWYAIVRLFRPAKVIETGVHDGLSSSVILAAMARNGSGSLVSIDLPSTDLPPRVAGPGWLVPDRLKDRWQLHLGEARRLLPELASRHQSVEVFIHDSDHSLEHMEFEYRTVRPCMAANSLILSDAA